jgi:hypothetical protein
LSGGKSRPPPPCVNNGVSTRRGRLKRRAQFGRPGGPSRSRGHCSRRRGGDRTGLDGEREARDPRRSLPPLQRHLQPCLPCSPSGCSRRRPLRQATVCLDHSVGQPFCPSRRNFATSRYDCTTTKTGLGFGATTQRTSMLIL